MDTMHEETVIDEVIKKATSMDAENPAEVFKTAFNLEIEVERIAENVKRKFLKQIHEKIEKEFF